jgi:undecaprenyl-diphosphatase
MIPTPLPTSPTTAHLWPYVRSWWWSGLGAIIFAATVAIGLLIKNAGPKATELGVDIELSQERNPVLSFLSLAIHYGLGPTGAVILLAVACLGLFIIRRSVVPVFAFGWVVGIGWLSSELGKHLVARIRPPADVVQALVPEHGLDSFPSGHTAFAVALAWAVFLVVARTRRARTWAMAAGVVLVALVAFSRLYLGVHYPSDVLASVFIASAAILIALPVWNNFIAPTLSAEPRTSIRAPKEVERAERNTTGPGIWPTTRICSSVKAARTRTGHLPSKRQR